MPLELRIEANGTVRPFWYGRFKINGKRQCLNLGVKVHGTPPESLSLKHEGDMAFERSRTTALAKLQSVSEEARTKRDSVRLVEKLYEIKTGETIRSVLLAQLAEEWKNIARKRDPDVRYAAQCQSTLKRFALFVSLENKNAAEIAQVTRSVAKSFLAAESNRGITAKTWNDTLKLLRSTFKHLLPSGGINPFSDIPTKETETIFRKPYSPEELAAIVDAARADEFIRPVLVTGICTAMRRGDCCLLKWPDVDLQQRFITVKTAKTGQTVSIPIFPMLYDELLQASKNRDKNSDDEYVFPKQAQMYLDNADGITWRVQKVLVLAGFRDVEDSISNSDPDGEPAQPDRATNVSHQQVATVTNRGEIHVTRKKGLRRASVRDFHSFRVTWVTLALTAGVPLELVQKVTGHKTTDIVLKHYFQPGQEAFRKALHSAMPKLLMNGEKSPKDKMQAILARTSAKTWKRDKARLQKLLMIL